jgi:hypothetical protein
MRKLFLLLALSAAIPAQAQTPGIGTAASSAPIDPAQLALARSIVGKLAPNGIYRRMMQGSLDQMMGGMSDQMMNMPIRQFLAGTDVPKDQVAKLGNTNMRDIMAILDPAFDQRMHATMAALMASMTDTLSSFEPQMREAMAQAYVHNFTPTQLADIDRFFNTPSGAAFAGRTMTMMNDPAVRTQMQEIMPAIMQSIPKIMQKVQAETANLPKPKTYADLTDADRARLAKLLGVDPAELKKAKSQ